MRFLAAVFAARIGQPSDIDGILQHLKALEGKTRDRLSKTSDELKELHASTLASSLLETGEAADQWQYMQDRAQLSVNRLQSALEQPPLAKEFQEVEAATSAKVDALLEKAKAALPSSLLETDPTPQAALDTFSKRLQALEDKTKAAISKAGWKPSSFLEKEIAAAGGQDKQKAKEAARAAQRAADKAKIEGIFGDTLSMLKKESQDGAEQLVKLHQRAINAGRAEEGSWNPFDKADQDINTNVDADADATSFLETGSGAEAPSFDDINAQIRRIEADTQRQFGQFGTSFAQTTQGQEVLNRQASHEMSQLETKLDKAWAATNQTLEHYEEAFTGKPYEPKDPAYQKLHEQFAGMKSKFVDLKAQIDASTSSLLLATKRLKDVPATSLLELSAPSFEGLRKALQFVQRRTLARAVEARQMQTEERDWAAYEILGLDKAATPKELVARYKSLLAKVKDPAQRARYKNAYQTVKHSKTLALRSREAEHQQHRLTHTQRQQAFAVLGLGESLEHEVQRRYRELRELEVQEDKHWHAKPRKHSAVQHAYGKLEKHFQYQPLPKKALPPRKAGHVTVGEARAILGVTAATPPQQIRQRFWALKETLMGKPVPTAVKLEALHALDDAYGAVKAASPRQVEVLPHGQLRTH